MYHSLFIILCFVKPIILDADAFVGSLGVNEPNLRYRRAGQHTEESKNRIQKRRKFNMSLA
jgi:hypothetical protein